MESASKEKAWRSGGVVGLIVFLFSGRTSSRGIIMYRYTFPSWPSCLVLFCYDSPSTGTSPNCFCTTSGLWKKCKGTSFMATCVLESTDNCRACLARTYLQSPNLLRDCSKAAIMQKTFAAEWRASHWHMRFSLKLCQGPRYREAREKSC